MPRVHDDLQEVVVFLYRDRDSAERGEKYGGSGFLAAAAWDQDPHRHHIYVVTNKHVILDGFPVVRVNRRDGTVDIWEFESADWEPDPNHDITVCNVQPSNEQVWSSISIEEENEFDFISDIDIDDHSIGIGDDVFSLGRLIDVDGIQRNRPVAQFGSIAMMPPEVISGQESILVEMRSRTGFSGSPVFVFIEPTYETLRPKSRKVTNAHRMYGPWLLGIRWGQLLTFDQGDPDRIKYAPGMILVVPAQRIKEFIMNNAKLQKQRRQIESLAKARGHTDVVRESTEDSNPRHKEDFNSLLRAAVRKKPQDDQT